LGDHHDLVLVTGAGGFIGGNARRQIFRARGYKRIRAVDIKPFGEWYQRFEGVENLSLDLNLRENCETAAQGSATSTISAANMGGMGFTSTIKRFACSRSSSIPTVAGGQEIQSGEIFLLLIRVCIQRKPAEDIRSSVAQRSGRLPWPSREDGYGWEKLFSERMCRHFLEDFGLYTRVARFHNVYGPWGTWVRRTGEGSRGDLPEGN